MKSTEYPWQVEQPEDRAPKYVREVCVVKHDKRWWVKALCGLLNKPLPVVDRRWEIVEVRY